MEKLQKLQKLQKLSKNSSAKETGPSCSQKFICSKMFVEKTTNQQIWKFSKIKLSPVSIIQNSANTKPSNLELLTKLTSLIIVRTPPPPFVKRGGVNLDYLPRRGGNLKNLGWKGVKVAGAGLLKRWGLALFKVFFLEITLPFAKLHFAFEEKLFFSATIILGKKAILSCLKTNLKISHKLQ